MHTFTEHHEGLPTGLSVSASSRSDPVCLAVASRIPNVKLGPPVTSPLWLYLASLDQGPALGMSPATQAPCLPPHLYLRPLDSNILAPFVYGSCFQVAIMSKLMPLLFWYCSHAVVTHCYGYSMSVSVTGRQLHTRKLCAHARCCISVPTEVSNTD